MYGLVYEGQVPFTQWVSSNKGRAKPDTKAFDGNEDYPGRKDALTSRTLPHLKRKPSLIPPVPPRVKDNDTMGRQRRRSSNVGPPLVGKSSKEDSMGEAPNNRRQGIAVRRQSTATLMVDMSSMLPAQCTCVSLGGSTLMVLDQSGVLMLFCNKGMKSLQGVQEGTVLACSDTHMLWANTRGLNYCTDPENVQIPQGLTGISVRHVAAGHGYSLCSSNEGKLYSWGKGDKGCLGHGDTQSRQEPTLVTYLPFTTVVCISAGYSHSAITASDGDVYVFGSGKQGQLGTGGTSDQHFPISLDIETHALSVECGGDERHPFTLVLTSNGAVMSCGDNEQGRLGLGNKKSCNILTSINKDCFSGERVVDVSAGVDHCMAVTKSGAVYSWGLLSARDKFGATRTSAVLSPKRLEQGEGVKSYAGCKFSVICTQKKK